MRNLQANAPRGAPAGVALAAALRQLQPSDTLDLDALGLADHQLRLWCGAWILASAGSGADLSLGGAAGARMRIVRHGITYLLAGANGHASVLAAIKACRGDETILIAPGVYCEAQRFVIDRSVTLQGVSRQGTPIVDAADVAATIIAPRVAGGASFAILAPGVVMQGLSFLAAGHQHADIPRLDAAAMPPVQRFDQGGKLLRVYPDIQAALDAAAAGDRIQVPAGRHVGDLRIRASVTLAGMNTGRPGASPRRETETTILGKITMGRSASDVVLDGLVVWGNFVMEPAVAQERRFALRNCVLDGRDSDTAIAVARGACSEIVNNLIRGGNGAAIGIERGFNQLSICGNRIEAAAGAVGIAIRGGPGADRVEILGNTLLDGDYGVFFHVDSCLGCDDTFLLSGNHFGQHGGGLAASAPVFAVHADGVLPATLRASLDASLALNIHHAAPTAADLAACEP